MSFAPTSIPHPGTLKRYSSSYDDPFAEVMGQFESMPPEQPASENASIDRDHKLLSFSPPIFNFTLLDYSLRRTALSLNAQLHGMFFLAESPWANATDNVIPPTELTCYRRNLFQITGSIILPRTLRYLMTDQGDRIPILAQELSISATESVESNPVKIISVPWKTPASNTTQVAEDKTEKEPQSIPLETMAGSEMDGDFVTYPIAWKRLQFRIATANNGRRKELQQHFVVRLKVMATLSTGAKVSIAEVRSGPIIVRGRSPRNFQSRKDLPLSGSSASVRKNMQPPTSVARTSTTDSMPSLTLQATSSQSDKSPELAIPHPQQMFQFESPQLEHPPSGFADWTRISPVLPHQQHNMQTIPPPLSTPTYSNPTSTPQIPAPYPSPEILRSSNALSQPHHPSHAPIPLSLAEDMDYRARNQSALSTPITAEPQPLETPQSSASKKLKRAHSTSAPRPPLIHSISNPAKVPRVSRANSSSYATRPASSSLVQQHHHAQPLNSPNEAVDLLYEYFPLGLDDWMPPVDAVYRPHVVHHTNLPPDPKAMAVRQRSKRYFSEVEGSYF